MPFGREDSEDMAAALFLFLKCAMCILRLDSATFSEIQSTLFRKSKAYLSEAECNCLFSTQAELLFHVW